jgi:hypothetical protein
VSPSPQTRCPGLFICIRFHCCPAKNRIGSMGCRFRFSRSGPGFEKCLEHRPFLEKGGRENLQQSVEGYSKTRRFLKMAKLGERRFPHVHVRLVGTAPKQVQIDTSHFRQQAPAKSSISRTRLPVNRTPVIRFGVRKFPLFETLAAPGLCERPRPPPATRYPPVISINDSNPAIHQYRRYLQRPWSNDHRLAIRLN